MLTVSDYEGFAKSGGMIEFTEIDKRISVRINADAIAKANLSVQDRLQKLANATPSGAR